MSITSEFENAMLEGKLELALGIVQKARPEELSMLIGIAQDYPGPVASAVIALARSLLRIADLEKELAEAKKANAEAAIRLMREKQAAKQTPDDDTPSPF